METVTRTEINGHHLYHDTGLVGKSLMAEERGYSVVPIRSADTERVLVFLRRFFFRDEPLNLCVKLLEEHPTCDELEGYCTESIPEGLSLMAVSPTDEILGVCLNGVVSREEKPEPVGECRHPKFKKILELLTRVTKESDVLGKYPDVEKVLDIKVASVHEDYRGRGIAKALFDATRKMAKDLGYKLVKVDCSSHFTALAVSKLGFECIYSLSYKDHLGADGKPVFEPAPPHTAATVYIYHVK